MKKFLKPSDLAKAVNISSQQVRNYEEWGFIPPSERSPAGYRLYTPHHLDAIRVVRVAIMGYGWARALTIMQAAHKHELHIILTLIDERHAEIHQRRQQIQAALDILRTTSTTFPDLPTSHTHSRSQQLFHVNEVAEQVGVRVSAVRFWEDQGLIHPIRNPNNNYRMYDYEQLRRLQIVTLLRKTGYDFDAIRPVLDQLASGNIEQVLQAAEKRLRILDQETQHCIQATIQLWSYLNPT